MSALARWAALAIGAVVFLSCGDDDGGDPGGDAGTPGVYGDAVCGGEFLTVRIEGPYELTEPSASVAGAFEARFAFSKTAKSQGRRHRSRARSRDRHQQVSWLVRNLEEKGPPSATTSPSRRPWRARRAARGSAELSGPYADQNADEGGRFHAPARMSTIVDTRAVRLLSLHVAPDRAAAQPISPP